jgi:hypothetical protein
MEGAVKAQIAGSGRILRKSGDRRSLPVLVAGTVDSPRGGLADRFMQHPMVRSTCRAAGFGVSAADPHSEERRR